MNQEIERKFLVPNKPNDLEILKKQEIEQTYLAHNDTESIRVRRIDQSKYTMTFKSGRGLVRDEVEFAINETTYNQLLKNSQLIALRKTRFKVLIDHNKFDLDVYHNTKELNLMTIEIEFASEEVAAQFAPPTWFGKEVTGEAGYINQNLWVEIQDHKTLN